MGLLEGGVVGIMVMVHCSLSGNENNFLDGRTGSGAYCIILWDVHFGINAWIKEEGRLLGWVIVVIFIAKPTRSRTGS
jgi:hypothetical protein